MSWKCEKVRDLRMPSDSSHRGTRPELIRFRGMILEIARDLIDGNGGRYLHADEIGS
jgi:hypothetical protein